MKQKTLKIECQFKCGGQVDWYVCDEEGENCVIGTAVQCGYCGQLNTEAPKPMHQNTDWEKLRKDFVKFYHQAHNHLGIPIQVPSKVINDYWMAKLQAREEWLLKQVKELPWNGQVVNPEWRDEVLTILTPERE